MGEARGFRLSIKGENSPLLRCSTLQETASAAICITAELSLPKGYCWAFLSEDESSKKNRYKNAHIPYWIFCTKHGVLIGRGFYEFYVPESSGKAEPVLIYDYDSYSYMFCDSTHFISKEAAWTVLFNELELQPPPIATTPPPGKFIHNGEYMKHHLTPETVGTEYRPKFFN